MNKRELRRALEMLPRYNINRSNTRTRWSGRGRRMMTSLGTIPSKPDKLIRRIMENMFALNYPAKIEMVDVSGDNVWVVHSSLRSHHARWLCNRGWTWQRWCKRKLPAIVRFKNKILIWNGTHRTVLCRLAGKRLRAKVYDICEFAAWREARDDRPYGAKWRVINIKARKDGHRNRKRDAS